MNGNLTYTFKDEAERDGAFRIMGHAALLLRDSAYEAVASQLTNVAHDMVKGMELTTCPVCDQSVLALSDLLHERG